MAEIFGHLGLTILIRNFQDIVLYVYYFTKQNFSNQDHLVYIKFETNIILYSDLFTIKKVVLGSITTKVTQSVRTLRIKIITKLGAELFAELRINPSIKLRVLL